MATIKSTTLDETPAGKRLAKVVFQPQGPNPAKEPDIEVVFEMKKLDAVHLDAEPYGVIGPLSCTRTDTREHYRLTEEQRDACIEAAMGATAEADGLAYQS